MNDEAPKPEAAKASQGVILAAVAVLIGGPLVYLVYRNIERTESPVVAWLHLHFTEARRNPTLFDVATPTADSDDRREAYRVIAASRGERIPAPSTMVIDDGVKISCTNITLEGGANEGKKIGVITRQPKPDADGRSVWQIQALSTKRACVCSGEIVEGCAFR